MGSLGWPELLLIAVVILVLFGSKKRPDAARSLGRSLRIFKSETKGLVGDDKDDKDDKSAAPAQPAPAPRFSRTPSEIREAEMAEIGAMTTAWKR